MKRSVVIKALDDAFDDTLALQYRNDLVDPLAVDRPNRDDINAKFQRALRINLEAYDIALRTIQANTTLEDDEKSTSGE